MPEVSTAENSGPDVVQPRSRRKRRDEPLTVEAGIMLLEHGLSRLRGPTARRLAEEAARKKVTARCLRVAGLLALSGIGVTSKSLERAAAIEHEPVVKVALDILTAQERLQDFARRGRLIPEAGALLRGLTKELDALTQVAERPLPKSQTPPRN